MRMNSVLVNGIHEFTHAEENDDYMGDQYMATHWRIDEQAPEAEKILFQWMLNAIAEGEQMRSMRINVTTHYVDITLPPSLVRARFNRVVWFAPKGSEIYVEANLWHRNTFGFGCWDLVVTDSSSITEGALSNGSLWRDDDGLRQCKTDFTYNFVDWMKQGIVIPTRIEPMVEINASATKSVSEVRNPDRLEEHTILSLFKSKVFTPPG